MKFCAGPAACQQSLWGPPVGAVWVRQLRMGWGSATAPVVCARKAMRAYFGAERVKSSQMSQIESKFEYFDSDLNAYIEYSNSSQLYTPQATTQAVAARPRATRATAPCPSRAA